MLLKKVKALSDSKGMSIREVERKAGISNGTIGRWGEASPKADTVRRVAKVLGVTMEYLLSE